MHTCIRRKVSFMGGTRVYLTICLGSVLFSIGCHKKAPPPAPGEVVFVTVNATNVPIFEEWIGTLAGYVDAQIRAMRLERWSPTRLVRTAFFKGPFVIFVSFCSNQKGDRMRTSRTVEPIQILKMQKKE